MKRISLIMLTLVLLAGCGGKQLVWVDVEATAVPQPIEPEEEEEEE